MYYDVGVWASVAKLNQNMGNYNSKVKIMFKSVILLL